MLCQSGLVKVVKVAYLIRRIGASGRSWRLRTRMHDLPDLFHRAKTRFGNRRTRQT